MVSSKLFISNNKSFFYEHIQLILLLSPQNNKKARTAQITSIQKSFDVSFNPCPPELSSDTHQTTFY